MCELLEIPNCETEYQLWLQWLATDESSNIPRRFRLNAVQPDRSDNNMSYTSTQLLTKPYESLSAHEIGIQNQSEETSSNGIDLEAEKMRERPNNIDFFLGDVVDLELYAAELLQPLEHYISVPLSSSSILKSQIAFLDMCNNKSGTLVEQYDWLECHEDLADQVCEDLVCSFLPQTRLKLMLKTYRWKRELCADSTFIDFQSRSIVKPMYEPAPIHRADGFRLLHR